MTFPCRELAALVSRRTGSSSAEEVGARLPALARTTVCRTLRLFVETGNPHSCRLRAELEPVRPFDCRRSRPVDRGQAHDGTLTAVWGSGDYAWRAT